MRRPLLRYGVGSRQHPAAADMQLGMRLFPAISLLCVIDVQERLLAVVPEADRVVDRCRRLAEAARLLGVRTVLTETFGARKTTPSAHQQGIGCGRAIGRAIL